MPIVLAAFAALAVAVGLAAALVPSPAATVGGVGISRAALYDDLSAIAGSADYSCALTGSATGTSGAGAAGVATGGPGVFSAAFAGGWLDKMVDDQLKADLVRRIGLRVTPTARRWAMAELEREVTGLLRELPTCHGGTGVSVVRALPRWFVTEQVAALADTVVLASWASGVKATTLGLDAYYAGHAGDFDRECLTYIAYRTAMAQAVATTTATRIRAGTLTIAGALAAARVTSSTPSSPSVYSGCGDRLGTPSTQIVDGPVGEVLGPIPGTGSYLVSEVTTSTPRPFGAARADVVAWILEHNGPKEHRALQALSKATPIALDPRFGTYSASGGPGVLAPARPPARAVLAPGADTPE